MKSVGPRVIPDLLLLAITAGSADAAGYITLGSVFTSNMTGNVVLLGIHLAQGHAEEAVRSVFVLGVFFLGVCSGGWLAAGLDGKDWPRLRARVIGAEKFLLIGFALGWALLDRAALVPAYVLLALLTLAMGMQSAAMNRLSAPGAQTTAVTSTLTALALGFATLLSGPGAAGAGTNRSRVAFQSGLLVLYCIGAALSGLLILLAPRWVGCVPAAIILFVCDWPRSNRGAGAG